eukprot:6566717-Prymnesium_polylepis.1
MQVSIGEVTKAITVVKPVTPLTVKDALAESKRIESDGAIDGIQLDVKGFGIPLGPVVEQCPTTELVTLWDA